MTHLVRWKEMVDLTHLVRWKEMVDPPGKVGEKID